MPELRFAPGYFFATGSLPLGFELSPSSPIASLWRFARKQPGSQRRKLISASHWHETPSPITSQHSPSRRRIWLVTILNRFQRRDSIRSKLLFEAVTFLFHRTLRRYTIVTFSTKLRLSESPKGLTRDRDRAVAVSGTWHNNICCSNIRCG
jgi:hypothetical protein